MAAKKIILVKLGGSSITDKAQRETANYTGLQWIAQLIAATSTCGNSKNEIHFVIVHGAGSFGHHVAKEYGLSSKRQQINKMLAEGLAKTRESVRKLNQIVVQQLIEAGVNAVGVSPFDSVEAYDYGDGGNNDDRAIHKHNLVKSVNACINAELVPVIHGDACLFPCSCIRSEEQIITEVGIVSGDTLISTLARGLSNDYNHRGHYPHHQLYRVIFLTDVAGVYTTDPKRATTTTPAKLLQFIKVFRDPTSGQIHLHDDDNNNIDASGSCHRHDVTGGLKLKLECAMECVRYVNSNKVHICEFGSQDAQIVLRDLDESCYNGTIIHLE